MKWPRITIDRHTIPNLLINVRGAGDTINALTSVAAIIADESEDRMDPHVQIYHLFQAADSKLEERTNISTPVQTSSPDNQITSSGLLRGCWFNPTTAEGNFAANQDLYKDLASFLTISGAPANFEYGEKGKFEDTASLIANVAFDRAPEPISTDGNTAITDATLVIPNLNKDCIIQVKNSCYTLPLGDQVATTAWHAGLQVQTTMTKAFRDAQLAKLPGKVTAVSTEDSADWGWISTIQVDWATASAADDAGRAIPGPFEKQNPGYKVTLTSVIGLTFTINIAGPKGVKPATILAKLGMAVASFAQKSRGDISVLPKVELVLSTLA
ncbi:hypothetical protein V502_03461 [Pseudogymnoascus sp. VKM F-4520 (FW-2644)]|nr:hypothetical protein V502_03461 [Pseudogymnoascus sp. VKM F-4520 (FW-2644)]